MKILDSLYHGWVEWMGFNPPTCPLCGSEPEDEDAVIDWKRPKDDD